MPTPNPIQWHPFFVQLLRPLVESHYDVETNVPVGDAPRLADILLLRRTSAGALPFRGLWRWLAPWNVLEFKGPTVSARVADLDSLVELGLGIQRRLNEKRLEDDKPPLGRSQVAWWYVAGRLGGRFLRSAEKLLGSLETLGDGLWRVHVLERPLFLVSGHVLPPERDSLAAQALTRDVSFVRQVVLPVLEANPELLPVYGGVILGLHQTLGEEIDAMARRLGQKPFTFNVGAVVKLVGVGPVIEEIGLKRVVEEVGSRPMIEAIGVEEVMAQLTPAERKAAMRRWREEESKGD